MNSFKTTGNDDCSLVDRLWKFISDPSSGQFYIKNIISKGLDVPGLGINIPAFPNISVGDIPKQQMFKEPVLGYINLTMTETSLDGLDTYASGSLTCTPKSPTDTEVDLSVVFDKVTFAGKYDIGTGGLTGCAVATGAFLTGGGVHADAAKTFDEDDPDDNLELAQWYRDVALPKSENGKLLVGAYYAHQDTIQKVQLADNNLSQQYRTIAAAEQQKKSKTAVTSSTTYYQEKQSGDDPVGSAPVIGNGDQYSGGFRSYAALATATSYMMSQAGLTLSDGNEFAELLNSMTHFENHVNTFQKTYPKEVDTETIMAYIPTAPRDLDPPQIPVFEFKTLKNGAMEATQISSAESWPLNEKLFEKAFTANYEPTAVGEPMDTFNIKGDFSDQAQQLGISVQVGFSNATGSLVATAKSITLSLGDLKITISNSGWSGHETLYDKIATWIGNTKIFQDILKSKINNAFNSQDTLDKFSKVLNAGIKKLGL